jgi:hypothetical protein
MSYLLYKGDAFRGSYRSTQSVLVSPDAAKYFGFYANTGPTRNYSTGSPANALTANLDSNLSPGSDPYDGVYYGADEDNRLVKEKPALTGGILEQIGVYRIRDPEAIEFVKAALGNPRPEVRLTAVNAVQQMSVDLRPMFQTILQHIAADPEERRETRSAAEWVLGRR